MQRSVDQMLVHSRFLLQVAVVGRRGCARARIIVSWLFPRTFLSNPIVMDRNGAVINYDETILFPMP